MNVYMWLRYIILVFVVCLCGGARDFRPVVYAKKRRTREKEHGQITTSPKSFQGHSILIHGKKTERRRRETCVKFGIEIF